VKKKKKEEEKEGEEEQQQPQKIRQTAEVNFKKNQQEYQKQ